MLNPIRPVGVPNRPETSATQSLTWHILTGEYPPAPGGVSDYTRLVARTLVAAGDAVEIWAPACGGDTPNDSAVRVNWLPGNFGPAALNVMEKTLRRRQGSRRLLVQYVPHAFGYKAMNLWLIHWLYRARRRERIWAMFHEVCFPRYWGQPLQHVFLGTVQRWMAREIARTARRRFVTTPRWRTLLHSFGHLAGTTEWLPVPSNVTTEANATVAREIRARFCPAGGQLLGHFGTFSNIVTLALTPPLIATLRNDFRRAALLLGRGGQEYARQLCQDHPDLSHRIWATGELDATALADHLSACDLLLQPYHDGASARRGSLMASAALGLPIISSRDPTTESVWEEYDAVCLVENTPTTWLKAIENLLADPTRRETLGRNVWRLYQDCFAIERTVDVLRSRHREDDRRKE